MWNHEGNSAVMDKTKGVKTNGTPSMTGNKTGLRDRIRHIKSQILYGTLLHHPPTVTLWENFEV
jgi:hypothetical protein